MSAHTMLQPRVTVEENRADESVTHKMDVGRRKRMASRADASASLGLYAIVSLVLLAGTALCQDIESANQITADRVKRDVIAGDGDLTTVLLVDNQKLNKDINARNGRYLNVKPVIGLLTSTARTFIQDGVTTEYATEILGTTLDNGRVYAQLLTKSSLVLYDKPYDQSQDSTKKTRLPFEMNERNKWNLDQSLGEIDRDHFIIKNTDYVSPKDGSKMFTVFASKPTPDTYATVWNAVPPVVNEDTQEITTEEADNRVQGLKDIPRYSEFEAFNFLDPLPAARERKISSYNNINIDIKNDERNNKAINFKSDNKDNIVIPSKKSQTKGIDPVKVNPNIKLPTYTVKNEFSPIFYYIDNVESKTEKTSSIPNYLKNAKKLFGHKEDQKPLKTFTYYGFANFTTIVGDTVIVFSPSTATDGIKDGQDITPSAKAEVQPNVATRVKTFLSSDLNMVTKTMFGHQLNMETALPTFVMNQDLGRSSKALINDQANLQTVLYEKPMEEQEQTLKSDDKFSRVIASLKEGLFNRQKTQFGLSKDSIQPSETMYSTIHRTHVTDKLQGNVETAKDDKSYNIKATEPLNLMKPSSVSDAEDIEDKTSVIPETTTTQDEVITESNESLSTTENDEISPITEDTMSTPFVEDDTTDEVEESDDHSEDATCTGGIIPVSTMTTAYKTFTYLTTYFIPLEGTETTTSIKSHEVVSSETGYLTNLACKTEDVIDITPTAVIDLIINPTKSANDEISNIANQFKDDVTEANLPVLTTTPKTESDVTTTSESTTSEDQSKIETTTQFAEEITENKIDTTTERITTTSESHMEMSITTEESVSLGNRNNFEITTEPKEEQPETTTEDSGEIDLIFKTLYTTYTYFTTYFQGSTSTVSSKKSIITNVITQTLDLSEIDPSIFNVIESSDYLFKATQREELGEIQPTSVGIGRPTQTYVLNSIIDLVQHRQVIDSVQNDAILTSKISTPELGEEELFDDIKSDVVKTFYTTYTFFTTLYVEQDVNICSRSEVYTNYVGPGSLIPTKTTEMNTLNTKTNEIDFNNCKKIPANKATKEEKDDLDDDLDGQLSKPKYHIYSSIERPNKKSNKSEDDEKNIVLNSGDSMLVTDIKSSSSKGEHQIIDNSVLDDQVSSESNIDEIMPSPTLLLQTSFTTFTYFTTMYIGKDSSKVKSRLETVTNVVTETLDSKSADVEETNLPITYYTTFTYWTTLYKDKTTTITSREDIISNVVTPTVQPTTASPIDTSPIELSTVRIGASTKEVVPNEEINIKPSAIDDLLSDDGKATFFTTYTYFTTYYVGNTSELRSSLETITNIVDNTKELVDENQLGRAVGNKPADANLFDNVEKPFIKTTKLSEEIIPTKVVGENAIIQTQIVGTYSDTTSTEKVPELKIISSQVAIITGDSTIITNGQNTTEIKSESTTKSDDLSGTTPGTTVIEGSVTDPTTPQDSDDQELEEDDEDDSEDDGSPRKKSRLTFSTRKRTFTPVIRPFASRNRPTFSPKRVSLTSGATTITRSDFTPTITATPALKTVKSTGFGGSRKQASSAYPGAGAAGGRRFSRVSSTNISPTATSQAPRGFGRGRSTDTGTTTSRRGGFRTNSVRSNVGDFSTRGAAPRIRPTLTSRYRGSKQTTTPSLNNEEDTTVTDNPIGSTDDAEGSTQSSDGTSESGSRKSTNPLLRFRRPPFTRAPIGTTPRTTTQGTTRRGSFNRGRGGAITTTTKPTQRTTQNPLFALRNRQRPNSLFPPRGLINKTPDPQPEDETNPDQAVDNEDNQDLDEEEELDEDSDYESSNRQESQISTTSTTAAPKRISNTPVIRPFGFRRRSKRQATDYGVRRNYSNFRRPTSRTLKPEPEPEIETTTASRSRSQARFGSRSSYQGITSKATRAPATTKSSVNSRQPFILRADSKNSGTTQRPSFRTRSSRPSISKPSSAPVNLRPKAPRLKTYSSSQTEPTRASNRNSGRQRTTSRSRNVSRYRPTSNDIVDNNYINYQIPNDGKLTITHKIPMEVTIPIVNGKLTEYKNVLTAKPSIEILLPNQYSTTKNSFGNQYTVLVSEVTEPADNGGTRVIQFVLHETVTTSIIFTPTTIRGRKTSFSHIIPSTVYDVERVTSTLTPQINANVPLANILLSQLLLGNIGMPQPINPLLALQGGQQQQQGVAGTPTTEFKIKTTTYVTTVTDAKSTVLPITFRGKEILTTIIDSSVDVITATEYITETVVVTPTVGLPNQNQNQLNSILLLLQQPQFQQPQSTASPLLGLNPDLNLLSNNQQLYNNDLLNSPKPEVLDVKDPEDYLGDYVEEEITQAPKRPTRRKPYKAKKPTPPQQTSIITLYVSGRTPGEFSTVLSTVVVDETQSVQKREAVYFEEYDIIPSDLIQSAYSDGLTSSQSDMMLDSFLMPALNDMTTNSISQSETQSLESIVGEVSKYMAMESTSSIAETAKSDPTVIYVVKQSDVDKMTGR